MTLFRYILLIFSVLVTLHLYSQDISDEYSIGKTALLIDSLESTLLDINNGNNVSIIYGLAILYKKVDVSQAKKYALKYIRLSDSLLSPENQKNIYGLLAHIYKVQNSYDSSYYYLLLEESLIKDSHRANNEKIRTVQLGTGEESNSLSFGISLIKIIILSLLFVLLVIIIFYFINFTRTSNKIIIAKNQELETANTKLKNFNSTVNQAIIENTNNITTELEKSNNSIIKLRKSLKKAEESNYLKNAFLGSMSHKIRTPLSGILGFSDMLETELAVLGNEELFDYAKNIRESGTNLMSLITNIFDISNIEANMLELNIVECNLNDIIKNIEKDNLIKAKEKGINYITKPEADLPNVHADVNNIVKAINIIIDNAIKYTTKGFVTISTLKNTNNTISIRITDKGCGIQNDILKSLTNSFDHKKYGSLLTYQNNGLGLILAHRLIELMNGDLKIISVVHEGTEVIITLPCVGKQVVDSTILESVNKTNNTELSTHELDSIQIFIVEDDRMNRLVLEKMLKKAGKIVTAIDGDNTLEILGKYTKSGKLFDIMLFDINLPQPWDGIKLMHEVKKQFPEYKNIPFIAQTAYAMAYDKDTYIDAGFNDYIAKPINKTELITMIQKQLELFRKKRS